MSEQTRIFFRVPDEVVQALDALIDPLRTETMGAVRNRSDVARHLLTAALRERQKEAERMDVLDQAFADLDDAPAAQTG